MALSTTILKAKVAGLYGLAGDTTAEAKAVQSLDEAISEMNMELWEQLLITSTGNALTAANNYITGPATLYKTKAVYAVHTSSGRASTPMTQMDWANFKRLYGTVDPSNKQLPTVYSLFGDSLTLYFNYAPGTTNAAEYTITVDYYPRLRSATAADADDNTLDCPVEWEVALLYKAKQNFALLVAGPDAREIPIFQALYDKAITNLREIDRRNPDETTRFRMYDRYRGLGRIRGGLYTRLD